MAHPKSLVYRIRYLLRRPPLFAIQAGSIQLRPYQEQAFQAVIESVLHQHGLSLVWIFPRQSGKDESLAILIQYLLTYYMNYGAEMVFFNPTFKPQTETSMRRLEARLSTNVLTCGKWKRKSGYIYSLGKAFCTYLSAEPSAKTVGATANRLLVINEAQDISLLKYDKDIDPMAASTNATRLFSGTRWTSETLLEREYQCALQAEKLDGRARVFLFTAEQVRQYVPAYGRHVDGLVRRLGRQHPLVKTQFFCETVHAQAGMFPPGRQALMHGSHAARTEPEPGKLYAFLIDVAGQDECSIGSTSQTPMLDNPGRDSTFLKIVELDLQTVPMLGKPSYKVVFRRAWTGEKHVTVFGALRALANTWTPMRIVVDATGVGEGLWSLLDNALGSNVVMPVKFSAPVKSELGYGFLGMVESGRYQEYSPFDEGLRQQLDHCISEIVPGPAKLMRWGVPDGMRDGMGELVHDDDLVSSALCQVLDQLDWSLPTQPQIYHAPDALEGIERNY